MGWPGNARKRGTRPAGKLGSGVRGPQCDGDVTLQNGGNYDTDGPSDVGTTGRWTRVPTAGLRMEDQGPGTQDRGRQTTAVVAGHPSSQVESPRSLVPSPTSLAVRPSVHRPASQRPVVHQLCPESRVPQSCVLSPTVLRLKEVRPISGSSGSRDAPRRAAASSADRRRPPLSRTAPPPPEPASG